MLRFLFSEKMLKLHLMKLKGLKNIKSPVVGIDNSLEKYKGKVLSREKLEKANEMLKTTGLPKAKRQ